jgi:hypothetical protein
MTNKDINWTRSKSLEALIKAGDVIQVAIISINEENKTAQVSLDQGLCWKVPFWALIRRPARSKLWLAVTLLKKPV